MTVDQLYKLPVGAWVFSELDEQDGEIVECYGPVRIIAWGDGQISTLGFPDGELNKLVAGLKLVVPPALREVS